jgi:heat-inducible transcriptional repressor
MHSVSDEKRLDRKSEEVLASLMAEFISSGEAVASSTISKRFTRKISSAAVRNIMRRLEGEGLLEQVHTSGGRIPTDKGVRYYVEHLMSVEDLPEREADEIIKEYNMSSYNLSDLFVKTSEILSEFSNLAGVVKTPSLSDIMIKRIEFVSFGSKRLLGIFVGTDGIVENRIICLDEDLTHMDLERINNYCNKAFYGHTLVSARKKVKQELEEAKKEYDRILTKALVLSDEVLSEVDKSSIMINGVTVLASRLDLIDTGKLYAIMRVLEEKGLIMEILNKTIHGDSVSVFVGAESGFEAMSECAIVAAPYRRFGNVVGALGILGPKRMNYPRIVPLVEYAAGCVSRILSGDSI